MKSTIHHLSHPPPPPFSTLPKFNHKLHRFSTHSPPPPPVTVRTKVTTTHLAVLAANPPVAATPDLSVLIPTSVAFLFLYWIANFVVPEIILKDLQSDDSTADQKPNKQESMPLTSQSKKTGFQK